MQRTTIEWCDWSWNVGRGCRRKGEGCRNCYAEKIGARYSFPGGAYEDLAHFVHGPDGKEARWTGKTRFLTEKLIEPVHKRGRLRIFVNSMSDLFYDGYTNEQIAAIHAVMLAVDWHTYLVLTKYVERARDWHRWVSEDGAPAARCAFELGKMGVNLWKRGRGLSRPWEGSFDKPWPPRNVQLGTSVATQADADTNIPILFGCPAALYWVSYEPAIELVDFASFLRLDGCHTTDDGQAFPLLCTECHGRGSPRLGWLVAGGESGGAHCARRFDLTWARSVRDQCRAAGVPFFFKQAGDKPRLDGELVLLRTKKGGNLEELPACLADLAVRELPEAPWSP